MGRTTKKQLSVQEILNRVFDKDTGTLNIQIGAYAIDGPHQGEIIALNAKYNADIDDYELLTSGSGGGSTPLTYYYYLMEDDASYFLQEDGTSKYILG